MIESESVETKRPREPRVGTISAKVLHELRAARDAGEPALCRSALRHRAGISASQVTGAQNTLRRLGFLIAWSRTTAVLLEDNVSAADRVQEIRRTLDLILSVLSRRPQKSVAIAKRTGISVAEVRAFLAHLQALGHDIQRRRRGGYCLGETSTVVPDPTESIVLAVLDQSPDDIFRQDVLASVWPGSASSLIETTARLVDQGVIRRISPGRYARAQAS